MEAVLNDTLSAIEIDRTSTGNTSMHSFQRERTTTQVTELDVYYDGIDSHTNDNHINCNLPSYTTPRRRRSNSHYNSIHGDPFSIKDNNDV